MSSSKCRSINMGNNLTTDFLLGTRFMRVIIETKRAANQPLFLLDIW